MNKIDYIIKEDNTQNVFLSENALDICEILQKYYKYLLDSMEHEDLILKYRECNLFKELVYDNKVVGFCSYDFSREFITAALNNVYVLPEFRGNHIFLNELENTMVEHNKPSIMEPTRLVVELLIKYGFASKINENIVASAIEFVIPGDHVYSNFDYDNDELSTHFYDLSICGSIHILDIDKSHIAYSAPLNYDIVNYDCLDNRNNIDDDYFREITQLFKNQDVELMNIILDLEDNLPIVKLSLEDVIGGEGGFSFYIESLIDDAHVTRSKAFEIKNQIKEEYESGMILNDSLLIRLAYLFNENHEPTITSHEDICSYCSMPIDSHDKFCHFCGINLDYDPDEMQKNLFKSINTQKSDFREDIRFIAYKFLRSVDEGIDLKYSIFTIETTYNINYNTLKHFLNSNNYFNQDSITNKGYEFLNSHPLHFWEKYHMDIINYTDFESYFYEHSHLNPKDICLNFLKQYGDEDYILEIIDEIKHE